MLGSDVIVKVSAPEDREVHPCLTSASINADEQRPLITVEHSDFYSNLIFGTILFLFLLVGVSVGAYLLVNEVEDEGDLSFVGLEVQSEDEGKLLKTPVWRVRLLETGTRKCLGVEGCREDMQKLVTRYNFLVTGDGSVFEGRGWRRACADDTSTFNIGFLGTFDRDRPSKPQIAGARKLVKMAKDKHVVQQCFSWTIRESDYMKSPVLLDVIEELQAENFKYCRR